MNSENLMGDYCQTKGQWPNAWLQWLRRLGGGAKPSLKMLTQSRFQKFIPAEEETSLSVWLIRSSFNGYYLLISQCSHNSNLKRKKEHLSSNIHSQTQITHVSSKLTYFGSPHIMCINNWEDGVETPVKGSSACLIRSGGDEIVLPKPPPQLQTSSWSLCQVHHLVIWGLALLIHYHPLNGHKVHPGPLPWCAKTRINVAALQQKFR